MPPREVYPLIALIGGAMAGVTGMCVSKAYEAWNDRRNAMRQNFSESPQKCAQPGVMTNVLSAIAKLPTLDEIKTKLTKW